MAWLEKEISIIYGKSTFEGEVVIND